MSFFFQEHKETIKIIASIATMIAGFVLVILRHPLIGLIALLGGLTLFCYTLSRLLRTGGYSGEAAATNGVGGKGRQQSAKNEMVSSANVSSETTPGIWEQMTDDTTDR